MKTYPTKLDVPDSPYEAHRRAEIDGRWAEIVAAFPDDARLKPPVIYAVPIPLLKCLKTQVPDLLSDKDLRFEKRLRGLAGTGFLDQKAFACEILDPAGSGEVNSVLYGDPVGQMMREANLGVHGVFSIDLKSTRSVTRKQKREITERQEDLKKRQQGLQKRIIERLQGFAGWLVTNPVYCHEAADLAHEWAKTQESASRLPTSEVFSGLNLPRLSGDQLAQMSKLSGKARTFLKKWNLVRLDTWDLPIPIPPIQFSDDALPTNDVRSMGVSVFIPWSLLANKDLKIDEVVEYHRLRHDLSHLNTWTGEHSRRKWGPERLARMFQLFVYFHCAISRRYSDRIQENLRRLDRAFASYWNPKLADEDSLNAAADSVRKIREELKRRLSLIETSEESDETVEEQKS